MGGRGAPALRKPPELKRLSKVENGGGRGWNVFAKPRCGTSSDGGPGRTGFAKAPGTKAPFKSRKRGWPGLERLREAPVRYQLRWGAGAYRLCESPRN